MISFTIEAAGRDSTAPNPRDGSVSRAREPVLQHVKSLFVAPLLAFLAAWAMVLASSAPGTNAGPGAACDQLPRLVRAGPDLQHVAEAGNSPELRLGRVTSTPRASALTGSAGLPLTCARARPLSAGGAGTGTDHIPLGFRGRPPPL